MTSLEGPAKVAKGTVAFGRRKRTAAPDFIVVDMGHDTACHVWNLALNSDGYPVVSHKGRHELAHRMVYLHESGGLPPELDHVCNVRACVRFDHLRPTTHAANTRRSSATRLTADDAEAIRAAYAAGVPTGEIAARYGISNGHARRVRRGIQWAPEAA